MSQSSYEKYIKYKLKYLQLIQTGGVTDISIYVTGTATGNCRDVWNGTGIVRDNSGDESKTADEPVGMFAAIRALIPSGIRIHVTHFDKFYQIDKLLAKTEGVDISGVVMKMFPPKGNEGDTENIVSNFFTSTDLAILATPDGKIASLADPEKRKPHLLVDFAHIIRYLNKEGKVSGSSVAVRTDDKGALTYSYPEEPMADLAVYDNISCLHLGIHINEMFLMGLKNRINLIQLQEGRILTLNQKLFSYSEVAPELSYLTDDPDNAAFSFKFWSSKHPDGITIHFPKIQLLNGQYIRTLEELTIVIISMGDVTKYHPRGQIGHLAKLLKILFSSKIMGALKTPSNLEEAKMMGETVPAGKFFTDIFSPEKDGSTDNALVRDSFRVHKLMETLSSVEIDI